MKNEAKSTKQEPGTLWIIQRDKKQKQVVWRKTTEYVSAIMRNGCVVTTPRIHRAKHFKTSEQAQPVLERINAYYRNAPTFSLKEVYYPPEFTL